MLVFYMNEKLISEAREWIINQFLCLINRLTFLVSSVQVLFDILYRIDLAKFQAKVVMKYI